MKKVTMNDVAEKLNISRALVSYALHDKYGVSDSMKKRILTAAVEMGYYNRGFENKKSRKGVYVLIGSEFIGEDSFWTRIIAGVESRVRANKLNIHLLTVTEGNERSEIIDKITSSSAYGLIVMRRVSESLVDLLDKIEIPKVFIDLTVSYSSINEVRANNYGNMIYLTEYLIKANHKKILFVGDTNWALSFRQRYMGYCEAMDRYGLEKHAIIGSCETKEYSYDRVRTREVLKNNPYTAIVCVNDSVADYVYEDIEASGLRIPEDISVVGFDDVPKAARQAPPLTTMHIPRFEMGEVAFNLLADQYRETNSSKIVCLNAYLKERQSVRVIEEE